MSKPLKIERAPRLVIDGQLLTVLDDKSKVAIVLSADDLALLIYCLAVTTDWPFGTEDHGKEFLAGLRTLRDAAFGKKS